MEANRIPLAVQSDNATNIQQRAVPLPKPLATTTAPFAPTAVAANIAKAFTYSDSEDELYDIDQNCNQVRRKLRTFIDSGEMKIGELTRELGVSNKSLNTFLGMSGPHKGLNTATYPAAYRFFKAREARGIKTKPKTVKKSEIAVPSLDEYRLPGEETCSVQVFDTCDEVRKKINAYMKTPNVTAAALCREAAKALTDGRKLAAKQLTDFRSKKGAYAGNTSAAFYACYCFFEKLRIKDGKPKSKHRTIMEQKHPGGFDIADLRTNGYLCPHDMRPSEDQYGVVTMHKVGP